VRYQWGTVYICISINLYKKKCCDDAWKQYGINIKILKDFTRKRVSMSRRSGGELHKKFQTPKALHKERNYWCRHADDDKVGHYSLFVNAINSTANKCDVIVG